MGPAAATELQGMPEPYSLERHAYGGETFITRGPYLVARFDSGDIGMRNLAVVALTDAGHAGTEVAACFGITAVYVSMLRGRARLEGSAGLVRQRGRRPKLSAVSGCLDHFPDVSVGISEECMRAVAELSDRAEHCCAGVDCFREGRVDGFGGVDDDTRHDTAKARRRSTHVCTGQEILTVVQNQNR